MQNFGPHPSKFGVENHGIKNANTVYWHLTTPMLYEQAVRRREADLMHLGPLVVRTGDHTGRSANDKFIVKEPTTEQDIWWGSVNVSISQEQFNDLCRRIRAYLQNRDIFVFDGYAGADERYRMPVRIITEYAWHSLFARNMFRRYDSRDELLKHKPDFTIIHMPNFHANKEYDKSNIIEFFNNIDYLDLLATTKVGFKVPTNNKCNLLKYAFEYDIQTLIKNGDVVAKVFVFRLCLSK